jgi:hypothetical protein
VIHGVKRPTRVELDGASLSLDQAAGASAWSWDDKSQSLSIFVGERHAKKKTIITVDAP